MGPSEPVTIHHLYLHHSGLGKMALGGVQRLQAMAFVPARVSSGEQVSGVHSGVEEEASCAARAGLQVWTCELIEGGLHLASESGRSIDQMGKRSSL